jgi:phenylalanyl-tRNA synthetase beta chain
MGGAASGCAPETTDVIECALFDPKRTAETGRDPAGQFRRPLSLRARAGPGGGVRRDRGGDADDPGAVRRRGQRGRRRRRGPEWKRTIAYRPTRVASLGGVGVPPERQQAILAALGCSIDVDHGPFHVVPPSWRADIEGEADLVEEVLRIEGYDRIPETPLPRLHAIARPAVDAAQRRVPWAKRLLASRGLEEAVTWSFMDKKIAKLFGAADSLELLNPISADLSMMRPTILANLILAAARNAARGYPDVALFEVGPVFAEAGQSTVATGIRTGEKRAALDRQGQGGRRVRRQGRRAGAAGLAGRRYGKADHRRQPARLVPSGPGRAC